MKSSLLNPYAAILLFLGTFLSIATANVEKIIFLAPPATTTTTSANSSPAASPSSLAHHLNLDVLGPQDAWSIRTNLSRLFRPHGPGPHTATPSSEGHHHGDTHTHTPPGLASWFLVRGLTPRQRYEVRICWAAIEPTLFTLNIHTMDQVRATPALAASLTAYESRRPAKARRSSKEDDDNNNNSNNNNNNNDNPYLLLQVHAAADYFSHDRALMRDPPPPVLTDLILDPLLPLALVALPQSLVPTAAYLVVVVAVVTFIAARSIARFMTSIAAAHADTSASKKKD